MKIIPYIQVLMKISGLLPVFPNGNSFVHHLFEILKVVSFTFPTIYTTLSLLAFGIHNLENLAKSTTALYQGIGFCMGVLLHLVFWFESENLRKILEEIENLVNKSENLFLN